MRILVADDHGLFREGICSLLTERHPDYEIHCATSFSEVESAVTGERPFRLLLLDLNMPGMHGLESILRLQTQCSETPILIVSADETPATIHRCLEAGVAGYLSKSADSQTMQRAIDTVLTGQRYIPEQALDYQPIRLNHRQQQILRCLAEGKSNREIAAELHLSEGTVKQYVSRLLTELDVDN
ncbi:MAG: DNA-binding response regulator, partial [Gammaproteobacteria bacterium]